MLKLFERKQSSKAKSSFVMAALAVAVLAMTAVLAGLLTVKVADRASPLQAADVPNLQSEVRMVVERRDSSLELYISARADVLFDMFGLAHNEVADENGLVRLRDLQSGTWELGDRLIAGSKFTLGGNAISFEAMSLMLHPLDDRLPLRDSVDGLVAVAVCTAIDEPRALGLSELQAYIGVIAEVDDSQAALAMRLSGTPPIDLRTDVRDFVNGEAIGRYATGRAELTDLQFSETEPVVSESGIGPRPPTIN